MYGLTPTDAKPGITLSQVLARRVAKGTFSQDPDIYRQKLLSHVRKGEITTHEIASEGRLLLVVNQPVPGGWWVGAPGYYPRSEGRAGAYDPGCAVGRLWRGRVGCWHAAFDGARAKSRAPRNGFLDVAEVIYFK